MPADGSRDVTADIQRLIEKIGLKEHLSPTRSNGLLAMVKQMRMYALAFKAGHLRRRAAVSGLLGADGLLKRQAPDPIPDGVQNAEPVP